MIPPCQIRIGSMFFCYHQPLVTNKEALDYFFRSRQDLFKSLSS